MLIRVALAFCTLTLLSAPERATAADQVAITPEQAEFFESKVRPLLVKRCYECHGEDPAKVRGGLSLANRAGWEKGGDSGPAITPGDPDESIFIQAVRYADYLEMPPDGRLPEEEVAVFVEWVKRGAPDPRSGNAMGRVAGVNIEEGRRFWAFQPPKTHPAPAVQDTAWPRSDVDRFVLSNLDEAKLTPTADADPRTLLRRVHYVLTGLPPTPDQLDQFAADPSEAALAATVDRLLASPQYGETWGRHWLDVARYADSNGGDFNAAFHDGYRYRDYVIAAFNQDKPFDRFIREQIAGDLLPAENAERQAEQTIATGFLAVGTKMLSERDKEKLVLDVADEQVDTVGRAFLGMTLGCARCHDHKFDPVPTEDYYALAGIFRSTDTVQGEIQQFVSNLVRPALPIEPEHAAKLAVYEAEAGVLKKKIAETKKQIEALAKGKGAGKGDGKPTADIREPADLLGVVVDDSQAALNGEWKESKSTPRFVGKGYVHDEKADKGEKSTVFTPDLPAAGEYEVRFSYPSSEGRDQKTPITIRHAQGETVVYVNQEERPNLDGLFHKLGRFTFAQGKEGQVIVGTAGTTGYVVVDAVQFVPVMLADAQVASQASTEDEAAKLKKAALEEELKTNEAALKALDATAPPPAPRALGVREAKQVEDCAVCIRGEHRNRGRVVERGFLRVAADRDEDVRVTERSQSGRKELADWIARGEHPLTARVIVNRIWMHVFGEGLVRTPDNFGLLGERPTHPELLDTLAVRFVENGWSIKRLVRELVLSRTFRQGSGHREDAFLADAENRLLWRAQRRRLTSEALHDTLLQVSDRLDAAPGGPVVAHLGALVSDNSQGSSATFDYDAHQKRAVYLPIVRNQLPAILTVFDFADPDVVVGQRPVTNVPAQSLLLLNGKSVTRAAEALAAKLLEDRQQSDVDRIARAYELILGRRPESAETNRVLAFINETSTANLVAEGSNADQRTRIAWAGFVRTLFASTEFRWVD